MRHVQATILGAALASFFGVASCRADLEPAAVPKVADKVLEKLDAALPGLLATYKDLHSHPELSFEEVRSAQFLAERLRKLGFDVIEKIGTTGVAGILRNGDGPVVMLRTDMDALPVTEKTGLDYASEVTVRRPDGTLVGVMHACGHDMHMTCWLGTAEMLAGAKDQWSGTLVFIGQPAEELGEGAKRMLDDGLFDKVPKPSHAIALHCDTEIAHGDIGYTEGYALANVDEVDIVVKGRGGHGAHPHATIDPVVIAARTVIDLQTIVSRELDPLDSGVITVGSIHGGTKHNIIPPEVRLQLTVRSFKDETRRLLLSGIGRVARGAAATAGAPEPEIKIDSNFTPAMYNDPELTRATVAALSEVLGPEHLTDRPPVMGGEDFSQYIRAGVPGVMLRLGTMPPERIKAAAEGKEKLPSLHSDMYYPIPEPSIRTGVTALVVAALRIVGRTTP